MSTERHVDFEKLVRFTPVGLFQTRADGNCVYVNAAWCELTGLDLEGSLGFGWTAAVHPDDREELIGRWTELRAVEQPIEHPFRLLTAGGGQVWVLSRAVPFHDADGRLEGYAGSVTDISSQRRSEALALERESRFRDVADQAPVMIGVTDAAGHITFLNKTWLDFRGKTLEEEEGWAWAAGLHPEDRERTTREMEGCISRREPYSVEYRIEDRHGTHHWVLDTAIPRLDAQGNLLGYIGTAVLIDVQKKLQERLREELGEKETLLREVHHRVKNNLQIVSSLISFQARNAASAADKSAFDDLRQRLQAMSLVHEKLFQSRRLSAIDFGEYVTSLVRTLKVSFPRDGEVTFDLPEQPLRLPIEKALPAGMVVCELITNVGKYAFGEGQPNRCRITLSMEGARATIEVRDGGPGFPDAFDPRMSGQFGWQLIRSLVAQLGGRYEAASDEGAVVRFEFDAGH